MRRGSLEVIEFEPRQLTEDADPAIHAPEFDDIWSRLCLSRTFASCSAAAAAFALHALFIAPVLWAGRVPPHPLDRKYAGDSAMQWIVLDDSSTAEAVTPASLMSPPLVAIGLSGVSSELPSVAPHPDRRKDNDSQAEDHSGLGVMYGRYVGQIQARIDRAWQRPRTAIGSPIFQCQVQIDQDGVGRVGDVTLVQCNGDTRWRLSLVHAIEAASPLPAPPNPAIFTRHVLLEFRAMGYSAGVPAELYEPAVQVADARQQLSGQQSQNAFEELRRAAKAPPSHRVIELRIEGSKAEVGP